MTSTMTAIGTRSISFPLANLYLVPSHTYSTRSLAQKTNTNRNTFHSPKRNIIHAPHSRITVTGAMPLVVPSQLLVKALEEHEVIPSVVPKGFYPSIALDVVFPGGKGFSPGEKLTKEQASQEPQIAFLDTDDVGHDPASTFTIVLADPDAPSREDPKYGQWRHWVQPGLKPTNVATLASIAAGDEATLEANSSQTTAQPFATKEKDAATPYRGPGPPPGSGVHRYTFLLFREPKGINFSINAEEDLGGNEFEQRRKWNAMEFATKKGLTLVGATFFTVDG